MQCMNSLEFAKYNFHIFVVDMESLKIILALTITIIYCLVWLFFDLLVEEKKMNKVYKFKKKCGS